MDLVKIIQAISKVEGVKAIALGGSQSRNEASETSDYDIGVYYTTDNLDILGLEAVLKVLDDEHRDNLLNVPGEWGPWINGGGWLTVDGVAVDILLRDIKRVENVINDCIEGKIIIDYQCGHPFGFVNSIYAAETHYCKILWQDKTKQLERLKAILYFKGEYSPLLKEGVIKKFLWEAWFSLACAHKAAVKGDVNYVIGSVFRTVCSWIQVIYAVNNRYLMNEKGTLSIVKNLEIKPNDMEKRVKKIYISISEGRAEEAYEMLEDLHKEVEALA